MMILISTIVVVGILALIFGLILGYASIRFKIEGDPLVEKIDALLPQIQCGKCGYPGCLPYAEAVANGEAEINLCSPGGEITMIALADLLGRKPKPLDTVQSGEANNALKKIAKIDESLCIGCTVCIQACPVDAILGTSKQMHTVITQECTGCELCIEPCPVNCIQLVTLLPTPHSWKWPYPLLVQSREKEVA